MKGLILLIFLSNIAMADEDEAPAPKTDYGALSNSLQYLEKKWVDEPKDREIQMQVPQPIHRMAPPINFDLPPIPTCQIVPITAPDNSVIGYRKICL